MKNLKIVSLDKTSDIIEFDNGIKIYSYHNQDCCENHWLSMKDLDFEDLKFLEFDLSNDDFFERIEGYGIALKPLNGFPVRIPGYGSNNGYYSSYLSLIVEGENFERKYDVSDCQEYEPN